MHGTEEIIRKVDDLKDHSAPEHFGFKISGVLLPLGSLPNAESTFLA
jgi:hypothetical protein